MSVPARMGVVCFAGIAIGLLADPVADALDVSIWMVIAILGVTVFLLAQAFVRRGLN